MTLFEQYLYKIIETENVFNEDINYKINTNGEIKAEFEVIKNSKDTVTLSTIENISDFYQHLKDFNAIGDEGFKLNGKQISSLDDFKNEIKRAKKIPDNQKIDDISILNNGASPFLKITATPVDMTSLKTLFIDFFVSTKTLRDVFKEKIDSLNKIIVKTFEKNNKFLFKRMEFDKPIEFGEIPGENATENLLISVILDSSNKNKIEKIFDVTLKDLESLKTEEEKKAKNKNNILINTLTNKINAIKEFITEMKKIEEKPKGSIEMKLFTEPLVMVIGKPKT